MYWTAGLQGFGIGAGLIIAIGMQNAFVLSQGIKRQRRFLTAAICALCDSSLIILGIVGLGAFIMLHPTLLSIAKWGGILFLTGYAIKAFKSTFKPGTLTPKNPKENLKSIRATILTTMALSLLNPHAFLDTVVLLGSIAAHYPLEERLWFGLGAIIASTIWFFTLAYGASLLTPLFKKPITWRFLDAFVGCIMITVALSLFFTM